MLAMPNYPYAIFPDPEQLPPLPESLAADGRNYLERLQQRASPEDFALFAARPELLYVLALSEFVAKTLIQYPHECAQLVRQGFLDQGYLSLDATDAITELIVPDLPEAELKRRLRLLRRTRMMALAWRDLTGRADIEEVFVSLSNLAEGIVTHTVALVRTEYQASFGNAFDREGKEMPLLILGMGKLGGGELNFSSDIDLMCCYPYDGETQGGSRNISHQEYFTKVVQRVSNLLSETTADSFCYRIDLRLRPFGDAGPLVSSFDALSVYYETQGRTWERYALVKAKLIGDHHKWGTYGDELIELLRPFVYRRYLDYGAIESLRKLKHMIEAEVRRRNLVDNFKLGSGGIREIEFIAQVFELMRGGRIPELVERSLRKTLRNISKLQLLPHEVCARLDTCYIYLRRLENITQELADKQTQSLPYNEKDQLRVALSMGKSSFAELTAELDAIRAQVHQEFVSVMRDDEESQDEHSTENVELWESTLSAAELEHVLIPLMVNPGVDVAPASASGSASAEPHPAAPEVTATTAAQFAGPGSAGPGGAGAVSLLGGTGGIGALGSGAAATSTIVGAAPVALGTAAASSAATNSATSSATNSATSVAPCAATSAAISAAPARPGAALVAPPSEPKAEAVATAAAAEATAAESTASGSSPAFHGAATPAKTSLHSSSLSRWRSLNRSSHGRGLNFGRSHLISHAKSGAAAEPEIAVPPQQVAPPTVAHGGGASEQVGSVAAFGGADAGVSTTAKAQGAPAAPLPNNARAGSGKPSHAYELAQAIIQLHYTLARLPVGPIGRETLVRLMPKIIRGVARYHNAPALFKKVAVLIEKVALRTTYLQLLVENDGTCQKLLALLDGNDFAGALISAHPILLDELIAPRYFQKPPRPEEYLAWINERLLRIDPEDLEEQMEELRLFKKIMVLRIAMSDQSQSLPLMKISDSLTWLAEALLREVALLAWRQTVAKYGAPLDRDPQDPGFAIIAYGKLGGIELGYKSDLDMVFIREANEGMTTGTDDTGAHQVSAAMFYQRFVQRFMHLCTTRMSGGVLYDLDMRLRPDGDSGVLMSDLAAYELYQKNRAWTWEHQALVRARAVAGSQRVIEGFNRVRDEVLRTARDEVKLSDDVYAMRMKMRNYLDRSSDKLFDLKQGRGGMVDIEFIAQYLLLREAPKHPDMVLWSDNMRIFDECARLKILDQATCDALQHAYLAIRECYHRVSLANLPRIVALSDRPVECDQVGAIFDAIFKDAAARFNPNSAGRSGALPACTV